MAYSSLFQLSLPNVAGSLIQVLNEKPKGGRGRLGSFSTTFKDSKKETVRQVFLFTNHMLLTTRTSNGRLHLTKVRHGTQVRDINGNLNIYVGFDRP